MFIFFWQRLKRNAHPRMNWMYHHLFVFVLFPGQISRPTLSLLVMVDRASPDPLLFDPGNETLTFPDDKDHTPSPQAAFSLNNGSFLFGNESYSYEDDEFWSSQQLVHPCNAYIDEISAIGNISGK